MNLLMTQKALALGRAELAWTEGDRGPLWRVREGVLRLDRSTHEAEGAHRVVQLALPGDLVGMDALWSEPYQFGVSALTAARLDAVEVTPDNREALLREALRQQQRHSLDMAEVRTGPVATRVAQLLRLLGHGHHLGQRLASAQGDAIRATLPRLRELAEVVDAKTETVCRALAQLLPARRGVRASGTAMAVQGV